MDGPAKDEPVVLRLEENECVLELLLNRVTSSGHQDFLYRRLQTRKQGPYNRNAKCLDLHIQLQDLVDKYALRSALAIDLISRFVSFVKSLQKYPSSFDCVLRALKWSSKMRQRPILVACLECFEQYSRMNQEGDYNAAGFGKSWIASRITRWSFETCQQLDPALYWMLVQVTAVKEQVDRSPSYEQEYWRYIITNLPEFPAIEQ